MINWRKPDISDIPLLKNIAQSNNFIQNDCNAVNLVYYADKFNTQIAVLDNYLLKKFRDAKNTYYCMPIKIAFDKESNISDKKSLVDLLIDDAKSYNEQFNFAMLCDNDAVFLKNNFPQRFEFFEDRDIEDYIYYAKSLSELPGKKYSKKRNHIAQFKKTYPNFLYKPLDIDNVNNILNLENAWLNERICDNNILIEKAIIEHLLRDYGALRNLGVKLFGGLLYAAGNLCAFCVASVTSNRALDIHFEKAIEPYAKLGAYAVINNEAAKTFLQYEYINREEDLGVPGLRKAKLSYHPDILFKKYRAILLTV